MMAYTVACVLLMSMAALIWWCSAQVAKAQAQLAQDEKRRKDAQFKTEVYRRAMENKPDSPADAVQRLRSLRDRSTGK